METTQQEQSITVEKTDKTTLTQKLLIGLLVTLLLIAGIEYKQLTKEPPFKRFTYEIQYFPDVAATSSSSMNKMGADGWQIVSTRRATDSEGKYGYEIVFMKELIY
jgi:hypothetical protein